MDGNQQAKAEAKISDRPVLIVVRPLPSYPKRPLPPLYTIRTQLALSSPTPTIPSTPHIAPPPILRVVAALHGKAGKVVAKNAVGLGPLVTETVAALFTGAIGGLVGDPEEGRMAKR